MLLHNMMHGKWRGLFRDDSSQPDSVLTEDYILDNQVIYGTVNKVVDEILKLREVAGDFGEIVYAGMDWVDPGLTKRSMELMAHEVMPRINKAIGANAAREPAAAVGG